METWKRRRWRGWRCEEELEEEQQESTAMTAVSHCKSLRYFIRPHVLVHVSHTHTHTHTVRCGADLLAAAN